MRVVIVALLLFFNVAFFLWMQFGAASEARWVATPTTVAGVQPLVLWSERSVDAFPPSVPSAPRLTLPEPSLPPARAPERQVDRPDPEPESEPEPEPGARGEAPAPVPSSEPSQVADPRPAVEAEPEPGTRASANPRGATGEPSAAGPETPASPAPEAAAVPAQCRAVGPYASRSAAQAALDTSAAPRDFRIVEVPVTERRHWVYLPPLANRARAFELEAELRAKGIRDLQVLAADDKRNGISLGLYRDPDAARRRQEQIAQLGYQPESDVIERQRPYYWVQARTPAAAQDESWWQEMSSAADLELALRPCDGGATSP